MARPRTRTSRSRDADIKKQFETTKNQSFPKERRLQEVPDDLGDDPSRTSIFRVRLEPSRTSFVEQVVKGKDKVSDEQIEAYFNKNKSRFAQPERRDLRLVLTKTRGEGRRGPAGARVPATPGRPSPRSTRSTRPPRTRAARLLARGQGPAGARARQGRLRRSKKNVLDRADQDPVRLLRLRGPRRSRRRAQQSLGAGQGHASAASSLPRTSRRRSIQVHQGLPEEVEGQDELPRRLRERRTARTRRSRRVTSPHGPAGCGAPQQPQTPQQPPDAGPTPQTPQTPQQPQTPQE